VTAGPRVPTSTAVALVLVMTSPLSAQRARQGMLSLDGARIFYEVVGAGDPIVVVHGGPGLDHAYLQPGMDALGGSNTLVYFDQRGTGRSTADLDAGSINLEAFVGDIEALRHPEAVRALVLMNPVEPGSRYRDATATRRRARVSEEDAEELAALRATEGFAARDPATLSRAYRVGFKASMREPERVEELSLDLAASTARNGPEVARLLGESIGTVDWWDRLAEIAAPTLVIHGRYDLAPQEMSLALAEALPLGSFEVLDSGHFPYVEDREGLQAAVSGFFARLER